MAHCVVAVVVVLVVVVGLGLIVMHAAQRCLGYALYKFTFPLLILLTY